MTKKKPKSNISPYVCPKCSNVDKVTYMGKPGIYWCSRCKHRFEVK